MERTTIYQIGGMPICYTEKALLSFLRDEDNLYVIVPHGYILSEGQNLVEKKVEDETFECVNVSEMTSGEEIIQLLTMPHGGYIVTDPLSEIYNWVKANYLFRVKEIKLIDV